MHSYKAPFSQPEAGRDDDHKDDRRNDLALRRSRRFRPRYIPNKTGASAASESDQSFMLKTPVLLSASAQQARRDDKKE